MKRGPRKRGGAALPCMRDLRDHHLTFRREATEKREREREREILKGFCHTVFLSLIMIFCICRHIFSKRRAARVMHTLDAGGE